MRVVKGLKSLMSVVVVSDRGRVECLEAWARRDDSISYGKVSARLILVKRYLVEHLILVCLGEANGKDLVTYNFRTKLRRLRWIYVSWTQLQFIVLLLSSVWSDSTLTLAACTCRRIILTDALSCDIHDRIGIGVRLTVFGANGGFVSASATTRGFSCSRSSVPNEEAFVNVDLITVVGLQTWISIS